jgi:hypothetical protein
MADLSRVRTGLALLVGVFMMAGPAFAGEDVSIDTGNSYLRRCGEALSPDFRSADEYKTRDLFSALSQCGYYTFGVLDGLQLAEKASSFDSRIDFDQYHGVALDQAIEIVIKYLRENPESRAKPTVLLIAHAFQKAFPKVRAK